MGKKFIESFVQECYTQGLTELQAWGALSATLEKQAEFKLPYEQMKDDPRYEITPMTPEDVDLISDPEGWFRFWKRLIQNGYFNLTGQSDKVLTPVMVNDTRMSPNSLIVHGASAVPRAHQDHIRATRLKYRVNGEVKENPAYADVSVQQLALTYRARELQMRKEDAAARRDELLAAINERQSLYTKGTPGHAECQKDKGRVIKICNAEIRSIDRELRDLRAVAAGNEDSVTAPHKRVLNDPKAVQGAAQRTRNRELRDNGLFDAAMKGGLTGMFDYGVAVANREEDEEADRIHDRQRKQIEDAAIQERKAIRFRREGLSKEDEAPVLAVIDNALNTSYPVAEPADAAAPVTAPMPPKPTAQAPVEAAAPTPVAQASSTKTSDAPKGGNNVTSESKVPTSPQSPVEDEEEVIEDSTTPS